MPCVGYRLRSGLNRVTLVVHDARRVKLRLGRHMAWPVVLPLDFVVIRVGYLVEPLLEGSILRLLKLALAQFTVFPRAHLDDVEPKLGLHRLGNRADFSFQHCISEGSHVARRR